MKATSRLLFDRPDTKLSTQSSTASVDIVSPLTLGRLAGLVAPAAVSSGGHGSPQLRRSGVAVAFARARKLL
jgi:hypothetical protein